MPSPRTPRPLDHLVLPVEDLDTARARHSALGFTVAADARHPFGTENACVFFADGTYLEPLGIAQREDCEEAARSGNVFVARDQAYRFRRSDNGFSALVVGSKDAGADHDRFVELGMSGGDMLTFSRPMKLPDGSEVTPSFKLSFAADLRAPDLFGFAVERINVPAADRSALTAHPNGVVGISEVILSEPNPTDFQYFIQELACNREVDANSFGMSVELEGATITVFNKAGLETHLGIVDPSRERGLLGRALVYRVSDLQALSALLLKNEVPVRQVAGRLIVDPAPGQGACYCFEEIR
ncbi:VOC family protein [Hoeflea alexandrii]|uniref:VOC family protein n=1 Tax=Hoeflea alexandrii TaxID=288436 RepID=A0ABT1CQ67_9HYPH|nr:VOC family protein [Hoeflea alexandrii]MCO6408355.1 VOC family protein [Hoeflea alexandrii]MCY0153356.1 VOC family protein [Hoeflea alexandrii]